MTPLAASISDATIWSVNSFIIQATAQAKTEQMSHEPDTTFKKLIGLI